MSIDLSVSITSTGTNRVGQMYSLTCTPIVSGGSITKITWLKDDSEIMATTTASTLSYSITSLATSNGGTYTCKVESGTFVKINTQILEVLTGQSKVISSSCVIAII